MLKHDFDCLAVPLPPSFQAPVEQAILNLPVPSVVFQRDATDYSTSWEPEESRSLSSDDDFENRVDGQR